MKTKYIIKTTSQFKKDYKLAIKRNLDLSKLQSVVKKLANGEKLDEKYCDHALVGNLKGHRECHVEPNWLLVYFIKEDVLVLTLTRTGSHSDLFEK